MHTRRDSFGHTNRPPWTPLASKSENDLLTEIIEILQNSTIASERGQDTLSRFWAAYKKVSGECDGDMLETCNNNMDIVLFFAGLFSTVNTAFIVAMQPNPLDTTNTLLFQLIQISLNGPSAVQPNTLSPSTGYSSATFWTQALAYASLALSLLAAYGAVLAKQWLGYYKTHCYGRGSLQAQCKQRHRKFQTLESWQFQNVLRTFPMLLQMSLLLFGSSLGAWMWTQQRVISILISGTTGFGFLLHIFTIVVSVASPDCPFQTPVSLAIQAILHHFRASAVCHADVQLESPDEDSTVSVSAMEWILEISTNPDVVRSAVELMPTMSKLPDVDIVLLFEGVRDMFQACFDHRGLVMLQDGALAYGKALIHFSTRDPDVRSMLHDSTQGWNIWKSWRALYLPQALEQCLLSYQRMKATSNARSKEIHQADMRTGLRMAVATGIDEFTDPDDERLVWDGRFQLHDYRDSDSRRFIVDQLIDCAEYSHGLGYFEVAGDALLLASGIATTPIDSGEDFRYREIYPRIITFFNTHQSHTARWHCVALGAISRLLDNGDYFDDGSLLQVAMMAICQPADSTIQNEGDEDGVQFTSAIDLLNFTEWPKGNHLAPYSLIEIQHVILRVLPAPNIDNAAKYIRYWRTLIHLIGTHNHFDAFYYSALNIASCYSQDLAQISSPGFDDSQRMVLFNLTPALLTTANDSSFPISSLYDYVYLISTLARNPEWCNHLITDGHVERCIRIDEQSTSSGVGFYLAGFLLRISSSPQGAVRCGCISNERWRCLMKMAWRHIESPGVLLFVLGRDDGTEMIQTLVRGTESYMLQEPSEDDLRSLTQVLDEVLSELTQTSVKSKEIVISTVTALKDMVDGRLPVPDQRSSPSLEDANFERPLRRPRLHAHFSPRVHILDGPDQSGTNSQTVVIPGEPDSDG